MRGKVTDGDDTILESIRAGYVSYIINTRAILSGVHYEDGVQIRRCAVENGVTIFTSLDTVRILLDVLEDVVPKISTINAWEESIWHIVQSLVSTGATRVRAAWWTC